MKKINFIGGTAFALLLLLNSLAFGNTGFPPCKTAFEQEKTPPSANAVLTFNNVWTEHNVYSDGRKGMKIHLDFNINGLQGRNCQAVAYFYHENGNPLYNRSGGYRTVDGKVSTSTHFTPSYDNCHYSDLTLFIPYGEMHLNGTYSLKYYVAIFSNGKQIGDSSKWETFRLTWRTDVPESKCPKCGC